MQCLWQATKLGLPPAKLEPNYLFNGQSPNPELSTFTESVLLAWANLGLSGAHKGMAGFLFSVSLSPPRQLIIIIQHLMYS